MFKAAESGLEMMGSFLREVAALLLVFIPIDYYKNQITWTLGFVVVVFSMLIFGAGVGLQWTAFAVKRGRDNWIEVHTRDASTDS